MGKRFSYESTQKRMKDRLEHPEKYQNLDSEWDKLIDSICKRWDEIDVVRKTDTPSSNKALDKVLKDIQKSYPDCLDENGLPKKDYKVPISMIFAIIASNYDNDGNEFYAEDKNLDMDKL